MCRPYLFCCTCSVNLGEEKKQKTRDGAVFHGCVLIGFPKGAEAERRLWRMKRSEGPVSKEAQAQKGVCDHCELWTVPPLWQGFGGGAPDVPSPP